MVQLILACPMPFVKISSCYEAGPKMLEELTEMPCCYSVSRGKVDLSDVNVPMRAGDPDESSLCPVLLKRVQLLLRVLCQKGGLPG